MPLALRYAIPATFGAGTRGGGARSPEPYSTGATWACRHNRFKTSSQACLQAWAASTKRLKSFDKIAREDHAMGLMIDVSKLRKLDHFGYHYLYFFSLINDALSPRSYFEIGTHTGESLKIFKCDAVCVDPQFMIDQNVLNGRRKTFFFQQSSDVFFSDETLRKYIPQGPDLSFLDGLHRCEFLLRDFINTEKEAHRRSLILLHDCLPLSPRMADRVARMGDESEGIHKGSWTGDVWRVIFALSKFRSDLTVKYLDCPPAGLVAVSGLNASSTVLFDRYEEIVDYMLGLDFEKKAAELWSLYPTYSTMFLAGDNNALISAVLACQ